MKFINKFETYMNYDVFNSNTKVTPRISYVKELDLIYFDKYENKVSAIFNVDVNDEYYGTRIIGTDFDMSQIKELYVDDNKVEITDTYNFVTSGEHTVTIVFNNLTTCENLFRDCYDVVQISCNYLDTSNVTSMAYMFTNCQLLTMLFLQKFDTSKVTNMDYMFGQCFNLQTIILHTWNTSSLETMNFMFYHCDQLQEINLENFDLSNVTSMRGLFYDCSNLISVTMNSDLKTDVNTEMVFYGKLGADGMFYYPSGKREMYDPIIQQAQSYGWSFNVKE